MIRSGFLLETEVAVSICFRFCLVLGRGLEFSLKKEEVFFCVCFLCVFLFPFVAIWIISSS